MNRKFFGTDGVRGRSVCRAMSRASEVFPLPGGPQKITLPMVPRRIESPSA